MLLTHSEVRMLEAGCEGLPGRCTVDLVTTRITADNGRGWPALVAPRLSPEVGLLRSLLWLLGTQRQREHQRPHTTIGPEGLEPTGPHPASLHCESIEYQTPQAPRLLQSGGRLLPVASVVAPQAC